MLKRFLCCVGIATILVFLSGSSLYAYNSVEEDPQVGTKAKGTYFRAKVVDSLTNQPIEFGTLSVKYIGDQKPRKYALTDSEGIVVLQGLPVGRGTFSFEFMGYKPKKFTFDVKKGANEYGNLLVAEDVNLLDAVVVTDVANQIIVKKDTIEYNASSFKVNDTDMLEELIKKLPGVEISSDGKITANGEEIKKIMIDGKTFFLDDPALATKNLPAKIVEKVRIVEKKSDQAEFTGIDDGEEEMVLDLGIKKGMMRGWFGNLGGGGGYDPMSEKGRYEGAAMIGRFTDKSQVSIIGNVNNTNNRGFTDVAGSMMGSMRGGMGGGMGYGFGRNGEITSWMGGVNANTVTAGDKLELEGNLLYNGGESYVTETKDKTTMLQGDKTMHTHESGFDLTNTDGFRFGGELDYKISDKSSFLIRPRFNIGRGEFNSLNEFQTKTNDVMTNAGTSESFGNNHNESVGSQFLWRQKFNKPGRTLSLSVNYNYSNNFVDGFNQSHTDYYDNNGVKTSSDIIDQNYNKLERSNVIAGRISYTEPLGKNFFVEGAYRYSYRVTNSDKETFNNSGSGVYDKMDYLYSSHIENTFIAQQAELNFMKQEEKYNITLGVNLLPSKTRSYRETFDAAGTKIIKDTTYSSLNIAPTARFDYRFSDAQFFRIRYRGRVSQPSINQMMPVEDNSDPLYRVEGNPNLQPAFSHNLWLEYRSNNKEKMSWFSTGLNASYTSDQIVSKKYYTPEGVQVSTYENTSKPVYNANARVMINTPIARSKFFWVSSFTNVRFNNSVSYVMGENRDFVENVTKTLSVSENLRFTFRNNWLELIAGARVSYNNAWYTVNTMDKVATWTNAITGSANITIPGGLNVTTNINHTFYKGYDENYNKPSTVWNAEISKTLFKNAATLKFKVYDILKDAKNTYRTTTDNYIQDVTNNTLGQYFMLTFTWRFGNFGGKGGMMGGRGPMGRGPMSR
ncbi:MAG: outer membrane beta-barrel family protein [Bacteroidia bacterium]|nr:outer membrane beta-barrel family protein [Bacteroidia bacterium]